MYRGEEERQRRQKEYLHLPNSTWLNKMEFIVGDVESPRSSTQMQNLAGHAISPPSATTDTILLFKQRSFSHGDQVTPLGHTHAPSSSLHPFQEKENAILLKAFICKCTL